MKLFATFFVDVQEQWLLLFIFRSLKPYDISVHGLHLPQTFLYISCDIFFFASVDSSSVLWALTSIKFFDFLSWVPQPYDQWSVFAVFFFYTSRNVWVQCMRVHICVDMCRRVVAYVRSRTCRRCEFVSLDESFFSITKV